MILKYKDFLIFPISFIVLIFFSYLSLNYINQKHLEIINFIDSDIHENFEIEITNNLNDINNYLKEYLFIESHLFKRKKM